MATKKWTKVDERILKEFSDLEEDGCVSASDWVNGRRRQISKKSIIRSAKMDKELFDEVTVYELDEDGHLKNEKTLKVEEIVAFLGEAAAIV